MLQVINPTDGTVLNEFLPLSSDEAASRVQRSLVAFNAWRNTSFKERREVLIAVAQLLREDVEILSPYMTKEMGKPINEARGEVLKAAWCAEHYAESAEAYLAPMILASDAQKSYVQHLPLGPLLGILPWNAPFWLAFRFCAPALMAGNTCLMKHDLHVPACAEAIEDLFKRAGAPADLLINLPVAHEVVSETIRHPAIRGVSFTGSSAAGSKVAALAGESLKPCVMELGGADPAIVLADANLDEAAVAIALSRMINAGQSCIAAKRIIVEAPVYEAFIEKLQVQLKALPMGDPSVESNRIGPLARADLRDTLARQVEQTVAAGARCLMGGEQDSGPGFFYPVTLLVDVTNDMVACQEETFGPVAVVLKAESEAQAIAIANESEYGLAAAVWSSPKRGERIASQLDTGQVAVNGIVKTDPRLPSGGVKRSGMGRELGPHGIHAFVNVQQVWLGPKREE